MKEVSKDSTQGAPGLTTIVTRGRYKQNKGHMHNMAQLAGAACFLLVVFSVACFSQDARLSQPYTSPKKGNPETT